MSLEHLTSIVLPQEQFQYNASNLVEFKSSNHVLSSCAVYCELLELFHFFIQFISVKMVPVCQWLLSCSCFLLLSSLSQSCSEVKRDEF